MDSSSKNLRLFKLFCDRSDLVLRWLHLWKVYFWDKKICTESFFKTKNFLNNPILSWEKFAKVPNFLEIGFCTNTHYYRIDMAFTNLGIIFKHLKNKYINKTSISKDNFLTTWKYIQQPHREFCIDKSRNSDLVKTWSMQNDYLPQNMLCFC